MKLLWASNAPWCPTGYGTQTNQVTARMKRAGVDVAVAANFGISSRVVDHNGIRVYPHGWESASNDIIPAWSIHHFAGAPGWLVTLTDVWTLKSPEYTTMNMACWTPIDHTPAPVAIVSFFRKTGAIPIAMSRHGQRELEAAGLEALYAPHGIDTRTYRPIPQDAARAASGLPAGKFIVGMVANNKGRYPVRKSFPEAFLAFSVLHKAHPDALLYVHAEKTGAAQGVDLEVLAAECGIDPTALVFADQAQMRLGIDDDEMAHLYSSFDVLLAPSRGEGFGIPVVEAQACGVPVIVTNATAQPELLGAGWLVGGQPEWDPDQCAWWTAPSVADLVVALSSAYEARGDRGIRDKARKFAEKYDADTVFRDYWVPILKRLQDRLPSAEPIVAEPVA